MLKSRGVRYSLSDFRRHPWLHSLSILTIALALVIVGLFFLGYRNFQHVAQGDISSITGTVYLKSGLEKEDNDLLRNQILALQYVEAVTFKTEKSTLEDLTAFMGMESTDFLPEGRIFPDIFEVKVRSGTSPTELMAVENMLRNLPEIAEVDFSQDWLAQFKEVSQILNIVGILLVGGILFGCSFIIANFMGIRLQTRKEEVDIVRLIGANKKFIVTPFLWEGLFEGILGAGLALASLFLLKVGVSRLLSAEWQAIIGVRDWVFLSPGQLFGIVAIGITMAFLGSATIYLRIQDQN